MRNYIVASWNDADQYNYSGEQIGNRGRQSGRVHFNPDGSACVASYGDDELTTRKTSISIQDRILPQARRVRVLTEQLIELEQLYKSGDSDMSIESYSMYRAVLVTKRNRSQVLYERAISVKEPSYDDLEEDAPTYASKGEHTSNKTAYSCGESGAKNDVSAQDIPLWLSSINDENTFKNSLIKACIIARKVIHYKHKMTSYLNELKVVYHG